MLRNEPNSLLSPAILTQSVRKTCSGGLNAPNGKFWSSGSTTPQSPLMYGAADCGMAKSPDPAPSYVNPKETPKPVPRVPVCRCGRPP
ncbi:hypothetical protein PGT21_023324 [Puccinia graminis f. sp. tritici]|uniref:Uncharacterized protein n=1 Tax=Puccinia graminis f. sp. tritici TaxID=56615 RepID=A0A5B0RUN8_PUCGR|nr:hypothetical protein PGT21_023324 [Puccinia graminis f. sp. tritici]KAA1129092.1 hypothetical protein PGTUg99_028704 [Puccinia graminis f. sp. tritici]